MGVEEGEIVTKVDIGVGVVSRLGVEGSWE